MLIMFSNINGLIQMGGWESATSFGYGDSEDRGNGWGSSDLFDGGGFDCTKSS